METLELIKTLHVIDRDLGRVGVSLTDEALKSSVQDFHERWHHLAYRITTNVCGVNEDGDNGTPKRRGPRKRLSSEEVPTENPAEAMEASGA